MGDIFGDDVMAAALIDRLVHHCHLVTIRGNSYRMRQHTELWQTLHAPQDPEPAVVAGGLVRRLRRTEARSLVDLSDFHPAELSDLDRLDIATPTRHRSSLRRFLAARLQRRQGGWPPDVLETVEGSKPLLCGLHFAPALLRQ